MNCSSLTSGLDFLQTIRILALLPRKWKNSFLGITRHSVMVHTHGVWELLSYTGASYPALTALAQNILCGGKRGSPCCSFPAKAVNVGNFCSYLGVAANWSWMNRRFLCLPQYLAKEFSMSFGWRCGKTLGRRQHLAEGMVRRAVRCSRMKELGCWSGTAWELVTEEFCKT